MHLPQFVKRKTQKKQNHKRVESQVFDFEKQMETHMNKSIEDQGSKNGKTPPVGRITMVSKTGLKYNMDLYSKEHMDVMIQN